MLAVHFGAGNIGRGFIGQLLHESGYEVVFVDVRDDVVDALKKDGRYDVILADEGDERISVDNVGALHSIHDTDEITGKLADADLITTAVGAGILPAIAPAIAEGLVERARREGSPVNVIACENMVGGSQALRGFVMEHVPDDDKEAVEEISGFPNAAVDRIVPEQKDGQFMDVLVEPFYEWIADSSQIVGERPEIFGVTYVEDPFPYIERKLLTVNTGHSAIAYLGYAMGAATIPAALADGELRGTVSKCLEETSLLLAHEYDFDPEELAEYRRKVLARFENPRISDDVARVARSPIRKLGHDERFVSPALRLIEMGHEPENLATVIGAVLRYDDPDDEEAVELRDTVRERGERSALARYAGIEEDHPLVGLVIERAEKSGRRA